MYPKILPEVRGGAQRAEGSVVEGKLLYCCYYLSTHGPYILPTNHNFANRTLQNTLEIPIFSIFLKFFPENILSE